MNGMGEPGLDNCCQLTEAAESTLEPAIMLSQQALNTGSLAWTTCTGIAYWYMVSSWGGYSFVINIIPIHTLV